MMINYFNTGVLYAIGKGSNGVFDDTWVFDFTSEEWTELNTTVGSMTPESRYSAVGGGVYDNDDDIIDDTGMLWISMGINDAQRKLSDTWTLIINMSDPFQGMIFSK